MPRFLRRLTRTQFQILLVLAALLIGLRVALPFIVKWYVNKTLDEMPEYDGRVGDIDIHLWRGAYSINDIDIVKTDGEVPVPFFSSTNVDLSVEWRALFQGALVAKIIFDAPVINIVAGPTEETSQVGVDKPWLDVIKKLFPLDINRCEVRDGEVHYRDFHSNPKVDLEVDRIHMLATNLTNSSRLSKTLVAHLTMNARVFKSGGMNVEANIDPRPDRATFDLAATVEPIPLTTLNDFTHAYAAFDFEKGTFQVATELAAKDGHIDGYVKPIFDGIVVGDLKDIARNPIKLAWEGLIGGVTRLLRNQPKDRFATEIPIHGEFDAPRIALLPTLGNVLKNEFIRAYQGNLNGTIDFGDARRAEKMADESQRGTVENTAGKPAAAPLKPR
ncbi:MAG: DUF748 domain-containing protein [Chthoniobacterales bacterium]